jgi:two-component system phosphate regulon sensor histidine kinase PhoR
LTGKIFLKLIVSVLFVLAVALVAVDFLASSVAERTYLETLRRELFEKARMLATVPQELLNRDFGTFARQARVRLTWVARDGRVLADSQNDAERMENHRHRPELVAAFNGHDGWSIRPSPTMGVRFLYAAVPVPSGALRLAVPLSTITEQVNAIRRQMLASTAIAFLPSILLAAFFARYVSRRLAHIIDHARKLAQGDFSARVDATGRDELAVLGNKLNETSQKLQLMFEQLEREHAELEKLERVRKDFVINVSHELRTPLASIQGYTETLLDGALQDPEHNVRFLNIIRLNAERLRRLTEDLLTLSRIELNRQTFQPAHYDVNALLAEHVDAMRPMADKNQITLAMEPPPPGTEVFCDSEAVHQIVTNLVDNALKYTPEGGSVTVGARPAADNRVIVYVRDTGLGIPPEDLPRLFERFYRVDKARSRELGGTGLGLAIVKHLVRSQGGEVGVESVLNQGSTFFFTLPVDAITIDGSPPVQPELTVS